MSADDRMANLKKQFTKQDANIASSSASWILSRHPASELAGMFSVCSPGGICTRVLSEQEEEGASQLIAGLDAPSQ